VPSGGRAALTCAACCATGVRQIDHAIHNRNTPPPIASGSRAAVSARISVVTP